MRAKPLFDRPIAHRGLHDFAKGIVENSFSAFEAAIAAGYAIECDVQLSSDGIPYIFHDDDLERLTSVTGRSDEIAMEAVAALPLLGSAKGERPQSFAQFLQQVAGRTLLQIELKQQASYVATMMLAATVSEALSTYEGPQVIESFDPNLLLAMRRAGYPGKLGIVTYGYDVAAWDEGLAGSKKFVLKHLLHWPMTRFEFISCLDKDLGLPAVKLFRALGVPVTAWTITSQAEADATASGADQIVFEGFLPL